MKERVHLFTVQHAFTVCQIVIKFCMIICHRISMAGNRQSHGFPLQSMGSLQYIHVYTYLILSIKTKAVLVFEIPHDVDMTLPCRPEQCLLSMLNT